MNADGIAVDLFQAMKLPGDDGYVPADPLEFPNWAVVRQD
jgi:hypothetical protein